MKRLLPLLLLLLSSATLAESGAYRVEVIVLRNLAVIAEAFDVGELRSFSQFPDLIAVEPDTSLITPAPAPVQAEQVASPDLESSYFGRPDLPDDLKPVLEKGTEMNEAWRRLRSSSDYRPLTYSAWEQNRTDYYPAMRVRNDQLIDTQLRSPTPVMIADLTAEDPLAAYRSNFYQLDGSVQLRRSRFLHLYLDLELREPKPQSVRVPGLLAEQTSQLEVETSNNAAYGVFTLKQNRQIQTGRMQYFDTPHFGVLVLVTAIAPE